MALALSFLKPITFLHSTSERQSVFPRFKPVPNFPTSIMSMTSPQYGCSKTSMCHSGFPFNYSVLAISCFLVLSPGFYQEIVIRSDYSNARNP